MLLWAQRCKFRGTVVVSWAWIGFAIAHGGPPPQPAKTEGGSAPADGARNRIDQRWNWAYQQRAYPLGYIPEGAQLRAVAQAAQHRRGPELQSRGQLASEHWVNIGPAPIARDDSTGLVSGRVVYIAVNPHNPNHWLISAAGGGVWETRDAGGSWSPKTDDQATLAMGAIAFAPSDTNIVFAGTGEAELRGTYAGLGLLKSTNGGNSWQLIATNTFARTSFSDIKVDPDDPNRVVVATVNGVAGRSETSVPSPPPTGVFKSTNGGLAWARKLKGEVTDLEVNPSDFNLQYAGIGVSDGTRSNGVYRSTNAGDTWTRIDGPWTQTPLILGRVELAMAASNPNILYVSFSHATKGTLLNIWRTDDAWEADPTWTRIPRPADAADQNQWDYDQASIVDPINPDIYFLAGQDNFWKYDGTAWTNLAGDTHEDYHALAWAGTRLIQGSDGGVWSSTDGAETWINHNAGLSITTFYYGSLHPTDPDFALAGSQDEGTEKWTGTNVWEQLWAADGADNAISTRHPNTHWAISSQNLSIRRTRDGGINFTSATSGIVKDNVPYIAAFRMFPGNDDLFITGTDNLWKCTNFFSAARPAWAANSPTMSDLISAMNFAAADAHGDTYVFGTAAGELRLTQDGGSSWNDIRDASLLPNRYVTALVFNPTNANILYATFSGFNEGTPRHPGHIFITTNALASTPDWADISTPVNIPHNALVLDGANPNVVFVGTDLGIWRSTNGGSAWQQMGSDAGMPNVTVYDLKNNPVTGQTVAFSSGRGAFLLKRNAAGELRLANVRRAGNDVQFSFFTGSGINYRVEFNDDLRMNLWTPLENVAGTGGTTLVTDIDAITRLKRFYRVRQLP